jgi:exopolysaccharide production protein ExoZ
MDKIKNIQALRGIAVLFVVFFHLFIIEKKYSGFDTFLPDVFQFGMSGVDLFFVISGFVMVMVTRGKFQIKGEALKFLYHRASRIYPLYWVYSILALIVFMIQPAWVNSSQGNEVNLLSSFLLLPSDKLPLVQVGWTLIHEIYFYLVFFVILLLLPEEFLVYAILAWGTCVVLLNSILDPGNPFYNLISNPLTFEFLGGTLLGLAYQRSQKRLNTSWLVLMAVVPFLVAVAGFVYYQTGTGTSPEGWWRVLIYGVPSLIVTYCFIEAERNGFRLHSSLIQIGNVSYSIYLSHLFTINVIGRIWKIFSIEPIFDNVIAVFIALGMVLLVGFLSYSFVERPLLQLSRNLEKTRALS